MRRVTWPFDCLLHSCPICLSSVSQVEPLGASVPSLMSTGSAAPARGAMHSIVARSSGTNERTSVMGFPQAKRSFSKQFVDAAEQVLRAAASQDVDESILGVGVDVGLDDQREQPCELL